MRLIHVLKCRSMTSNFKANCRDSRTEMYYPVEWNLDMLSEIYIEALLVDEELADQVWEAWFRGDFDDFTAIQAGWLIRCRIA